MTTEGMPERIWAALDLLHEIKAQLRTHVEFDRATRLMAAVGDMAEAARAYVETALSSPPAAPAPENNGWMPIESAPKKIPKGMMRVYSFAPSSCREGYGIDTKSPYHLPRAYQFQPNMGHRMLDMVIDIPLPPPPALDKGE